VLMEVEKWGRERLGNPDQQMYLVIYKHLNFNLMEQLPILLTRFRLTDSRVERCAAKGPILNGDSQRQEAWLRNV
jgi:hypothetical protein